MQKKTYLFLKFLLFTLILVPSIIKKCGKNWVSVIRANARHDESRATDLCPNINLRWQKKPLSSCTCSLKVNSQQWKIKEFHCCRGVADPRRIFMSSVANEDSCGHAQTIKVLPTNLSGSVRYCT
jgi:hypothetical protein